MASRGHVEELLPDYHLGHLLPEEAGAVEEHLRECERCRRSLEEVSETLDALPYAAPQAAPPERVRERLMAEVRKPEEAGRTGRWDRIPAIVAAAALLAAAVLGWAYLEVRDENRQLRAEIQELRERSPQPGDLLVAIATGTDEAPEARGTAVMAPQAGELALGVYNLPAPPQGHTYQAWLIREDGEAVPLGQMQLDEHGDGHMTGAMPGPPGAYERLEITAEPRGAAEKTGPVYLRAAL
ncbi:hypothetical protein E0L93_02310 [Rubrobacter taiwanensis]|jgi:anti-sigma-K factor RskA|uniref:Regulator of SigK n=1 Tax=Rubrobacter taiwanensis TaxID=185139 RepID=A0A4V2NX43_9ACTN|nr:anti-sigma factor [Rubrobacter taiwanensis]TCJ19812.1 hypothetical protein E0L93_02310 [Rubrobacter taiwanensis]